MKKISKIIAISFIIISVLLFTSCSQKYTVKFSTNSSTTIENQIIKKGDKVQEPITPSKNGYTFLGWYLEEEKWNFLEYEITEDITLEAKWEINTYTLTYELNGGVVEDNPSTYSALDTIVLNNPIKEGYTFLGWTTKDSNIPYVNIDLSNTFANQHFIANWSNLEFDLKENNEYEVIGLKNQTATEIIVPEYYDGIKITSIKENAFESCYSLLNVKLCNNLTNIGKYAFLYCEYLEYLEIGKNVINIGEDAFYYCSNLKNISVDNNNSQYQSIDGNLYTKDGKILIQYASGKEDKYFEIPNGVETIKDKAFCISDDLIKIKIPNTLTTIGKYAFYFCLNLESINIPNSVINIGYKAFFKTKKLTIYCEATSQPSGWDNEWNVFNCPVIWGCELSSDQNMNKKE